MKFDKRQPRVVYEGSVAIYPDGRALSYFHAMKSGNRPLLVINTNELDEKSIEKILKKGTYRLMFCDTKRIEQFRSACNNSNYEFKDYLVHNFGLPDNVAKEYEAEKDIEGKRWVLENYYDDSLKTISPEKLIEIAKPEFLEHSVEPIRQTLNILTETLRNAAKLPYMGSICSWAKDLLGKVFLLPITDLERQNNQDWLFKELAQVPDFMKTILDRMGVHYVVINNDTKTTYEGLSDYTMGTIHVRGMSKGVLGEEVVHQLDSHIGFSARGEWALAVTLDVSADTPTLAQYYAAIGKASLFDGGAYRPEQRPAEVLADMYNMIKDEHATPAQLQQDFPRCYPLFQKFIGELKAEARSLKGETLENNNGWANRFSKSANAERAGRTRGENRTEPAPRLNGWVGSLS